MKKLISVFAGLLLAGLLASPASAQDDSDVYVLHGIPGVTVDVYVNGDLTLEDFAPEAIAGPLSLPAGTYDIEIFAADADPAADTPVIDVSPAVPGGESVSVIAHLSESGDPTLSAFVNDLSNTGAGNGRVTVRHTAAAPAVDIVAGGAAVDGFTNLSNPNEAVGELPAGAYPTGIAATGTTDVLFDAPLNVGEGTNTIVYAFGDLAGGSFGLLAQSFDGLHSAPAAVNTGNSGLLADSEGSSLTLIAAGLAGAGLLLSVPAVRARRVRA
ncbi:MAG: DUF4397 domain-containing protein [Actinomycetia bacterium]|nr:DUF4397 domain-containing protein [Actinomycetes bacterium]